MITKRQWSEFVEILNRLSINSSAREILNGILTWLRKYPDLSTDENFSIYGFIDYLNMDEGSLPVDDSVMFGDEFSHFKKIIFKYKFTDGAVIAMILRDAIEKLILFGVERECSNCGCRGAKIFKSKLKSEIIYVCDQCGRATDKSNAEIDASSVAFPTKHDLIGAGFI